MPTPNTPMRFTLTHKLFALLASTALLAVGGTTAVFILQLERGFVAYLDELDRGYIDRLVNVATKSYLADGDFERYRKGGWKSAHTEAFGELAKMDNTELPMRAAPIAGKPPDAPRGRLDGPLDGPPRPGYSEQSDKPSGKPDKPGGQHPH
jgi:hypothetical protein